MFLLQKRMELRVLKVSVGVLKQVMLHHSQTLMLHRGLQHSGSVLTVRLAQGVPLGVSRLFEMWLGLGYVVDHFPLPFALSRSGSESSVPS